MNKNSVTFGGCVPQNPNMYCPLHRFIQLNGETYISVLKYSNILNNFTQFKIFKTNKTKKKKNTINKNTKQNTLNCFNVHFMLVKITTQHRV